MHLLWTSCKKTSNYEYAWSSCMMFPVHKRWILIYWVYGSPLLTWQLGIHCSLILGSSAVLELRHWVVNCKWLGSRVSWLEYGRPFSRLRVWVFSWDIMISLPLSFMSLVLTIYFEMTLTRLRSDCQVWSTFINWVQGWASCFTLVAPSPLNMPAWYSLWLYLWQFSLNSRNEGWSASLIHSPSSLSIVIFANIKCFYSCVTMKHKYLLPNTLCMGEQKRKELFIKTFDGGMFDLNYMCSVLYGPVGVWPCTMYNYVKLEEIS